MKKRKNGVDRSDRIIFTGIGITCLIGLFVLMYLFNAFTGGCEPVDYDTVTAIVATNNHILTVLAETDAVATEQFLATSTALPQG
jgi:hypothetical protein